MQELRRKAELSSVTTTQTVPQTIRDLYDNAWIRGRRITRLEENELGRFRLDSDTAWNLGSNNVGIFIGGRQSLGGTIELLRRLQEPTAKPRWVIVASSKNMAALIVHQWFLEPDRRRVSAKKLALPMINSNIILATPERLKGIEETQRHDVTGILIVDMRCHVHKLRGMLRGKFFVANDRPQLVANFRNSFLRDGWAPPLFLFTEKPAKSLNTSPIARAYCLDAWWFVDGKSLRCGPPLAGGGADSVEPPSMESDAAGHDHSAE